MADFESVKADMILNGELFRDPEFECCRDVLFYTRQEKRDKELERVIWKRPPEILDNPKFMVEGASQNDFCQGRLGDCWFLSAAATLATRGPLLRRVVPADQSFASGEYAGIFRFRFWRYGTWSDVIIDDRLPVDSKDGSLYFVCNKRVTNEFWAALLEKAYAKLHGSYEALSGGLPHDALVDFTGGVTEFISPLPVRGKGREQLSTRLLRLEHMQTLMASGIFVKKKGEREEKLDTGLVAGHAYSITKVIKFTIKGKAVHLLRLRNPWGEKEWTGAWSDGSKEWKSISEQERLKLKLVKEDDGEFWMTFDDFCDNFDMIDICHMAIEDPESETGRKRWHMTSYNGAWVKGISAGGTRILKDTPLPSNEEDPYWCNPQYVLSVKDPDPDDEDNMATLILSLMQKHRRQMRTLMSSTRGLENWMGFDLLRVPVSDVKQLLAGRGAMAVADRLGLILRKQPSPRREVSAIYRVPPGIYCLVVSYGLPNHAGEYILRVATETPIVSGQLDVPTQAGLNLRQLGNKLSRLFSKNAGDERYVDAVELKAILNKGLMKGKDIISLETCRVLIAAARPSKPGRLDYQETEAQWKLVKQNMNSFEEFDLDSSGAISVYELVKAFDVLGINMSDRTARAIAHRFGGKAARIDVDDYIQCSVKVVRLMETYKNIIMKMAPTRPLPLEDWMEEMLLQ